MSREQTPPHRGMLKGFLVQGLDNGLERPTNPTEPAYKHPITGSPIGDLLWAHRAAIIQIEGRDYDSLISANPDAKLRYMDDDNELVIVGSSLELSQRLAESGNGGKVGGYRFEISPYKPKVPPYVGDYTSMHIFSIDSNNGNVWRNFEKLTQHRIASTLGAVFNNPLDGRGLALVKFLDDFLLTGKGEYGFFYRASLGSDELAYPGTVETGDIHGPRLPDRIFVDGFGMTSIPSADSEPVALIKQDSIVPAVARLKDYLASLDRAIKRSRKHYKKLQTSISGAGVASTLGLRVTMPPNALDPVYWTDHPVEVLEAYVISKERILRMSTEACRDCENHLISYGIPMPTETRPALAPLDSAVSEAPLLKNEDAKNMTPPDSAISDSPEPQIEAPQPPVTIGLLSSGASIGKSQTIDMLLTDSSNLEKNEYAAGSKDTMDDLRKRLAGVATRTAAENLAGLLLSFKDKNPSPKTDTADASSAKMKLSNLINRTDTDPFVKDGDEILNGLPRADHLTAEGVRQAQEVGQKLRRQYFGAFKGKSIIRPLVSPDAERWASYGAGHDSTSPKNLTTTDDAPSTSKVEEQSDLPDTKQASEPVSDWINSASIRVDNSERLPTKTPPTFESPDSHPGEGPYHFEDTAQQLPKQFLDSREALSFLVSAACPGDHTASAPWKDDTKTNADQHDCLEQNYLHPVGFGADSPKRATGEDQCHTEQGRGKSRDQVASTPTECVSYSPRSGLVAGKDKIANIGEAHSQHICYFGEDAWVGDCSSPVDSASSSLTGVAKSQGSKNFCVCVDPSLRKRSVSMECIASSSTVGSTSPDDQATTAPENKAKEGRSGTLFGKLCELFPERTLKESSTVSQTGKRPFPSRTSSASHDRHEPSEEAGRQSRGTETLSDAEVLSPVDPRSKSSETSLKSTLRSLTIIANEMSNPPRIFAVTELERRLEFLQRNVEELKKQALMDMGESERYAYWKRSMGLATIFETKRDANIANGTDFLSDKMPATYGESTKEPEPAVPSAASLPEQPIEIDPFEDVEQLSSYVPDRTTSIASFPPVSNFSTLRANPGPSSAYATRPTSLPEANSSRRNLQASPSSHHGATQRFTESRNSSNNGQTTSSSYQRPFVTFNAWSHDDPASVDKIPKCVETLVDLGFEHRCQGGRNSLVVYSQLAGGDLNEAIEIITEDQESYRQMNVG